MDVISHGIYKNTTLGINEVRAIRTSNDGYVISQPDYSLGVVNQALLVNATTGTNILTGTAVPAGKIWKIEAISIKDLTSNVNLAIIYFTSAGVAVALAEQATTLNANVWYCWNGLITLGAGDTVQCLLSPCILNDQLYLNYHGFIQNV